MNIHDLYNNMDEKKIDEYISNSQEENLYIEFKTVSDAGMTSPDDRRNFAKALSGYANSSGGLLIWGVIATKNKIGIDCAHSKKEIQPLSLFLAKLNEYTGTLVIPIVEGVEHRKIETMGNKGFAVTLVPPSDVGPHMAKGREDRYYKRSGDSFYKMEHFDIEDMFGRRKKAKLSLSVDIVRKGTEGGGVTKVYGCAVILGIKNSGRGTAKYPYLILKVEQPYKIDEYGLDGNYNTGLPKIIKGNRPAGFAQYGANADIVIHPDSILEVTRIRFKVPGTTTKLQDIVIEYEIGAEDLRLVKEKIVVKGSEILAKLLTT